MNREFYVSHETLADGVPAISLFPDAEFSPPMRYNDLKSKK